MNEIWNSIAVWFRERTSSPLYGAYIMSFIVWNWKIFYTLFWQDQSALLIPKIEYVQSRLLFGSNPFINFFYASIPPVIGTCAIIRLLPYINFWAHRVTDRFYYERKTASDIAKISYEKGLKERLRQLAEIKQGQAESVQEISRSMTEEDRWELEYKEFLSAPKGREFKQIVSTLYKNSGHIDPQHVNEDVLALVDAFGLISFLNEYRSQIAITEKGRFFMKKYLSELQPKDIPF